MDVAGAWVDVWTAPLDVSPAVLAALSSSLTRSERARAVSYRRPADARRFATARGWLRQVLGAELGVAPAAVPIDDGHGKPALAGPGGPCFNVSHAGDLALVAVASAEVGVDVEACDAGAAGLAALDLVCTPRERAVLHGLAPAERPVALLEAWTAKEACLKAVGVGLSVAPDRVEVGTAGEDGAVPVTVAGAGDRACWWVRRVRPAPGYVGAVARRSRHWEVRHRGAAELAALVGARGGCVSG